MSLVLGISIFTIYIITGIMGTVAGIVGLFPAIGLGIVVTAVVMALAS